MKRPSGLWILLSAGVLWLSLQDVYGIRATALIFGKSTTSTTTEEAPPEETNDKETKNITESTASSNTTENANSTSPVLTGIPQLDYIWDPNLPRVLNGYNLSEYPFYERVPDEEIEFKCDGLHDGFYASVPHKCQVYHHCLFGTRYDFLCANYTAFDMKTFICQFVSEVDCVNSKKFWHRNDALYEAQSTTTAAPLNLRAAIYTTAPPNGGDPITPFPGASRRPAGGGARRPYRPTRRRRPQVDYYDDEYYDDEYYDERPRSNRGRKRPRPRPRPVYEDDDYEEDDNERYESRRANGRRRPYRDRRRNKDRRKPDYVEDEEAVDDRFEDDDFVAAQKRQKPDDRRKPLIDYEEDEDRNRKRPSDTRRPSSEKREQSSDSDRKPSRKRAGTRRPIYDEYEDELPQSDDSRSYEERPRKNQKGNKGETTSNDGRPIIKPTTGTIYDRPRVAPRINLPVPKNAADKYAYKKADGSTTTTTAAPSVEEEYVEEDYEEPLPKQSNNRGRRPPSEAKRDKAKNEDSKTQPTGSRSRTRKPDSDQTVEKTSAAVSKYSSPGNRYRPSLKRKPPVSQEYEEEEYIDEDKEVQDSRPSLKNEKKSSTAITTSTSTTTTTEPPKKEKHEPVMRIIKRPFLPSRGGNPYGARGLQPVGVKAVNKPVSDNDSQEARNGDNGGTNTEEGTDYTDDSNSREAPDHSSVRDSSKGDEEIQNKRKPFFKPSPVLVTVPIRPKYTPPSAEAQELIDSEPSRPQTYQAKNFVGPRTTQKPKIVEKNPLDLNEYDVTLNDALNPTLPNLPVRAFPTGFSSASDYNYNTYSRPRYVLEPAISPSNQNFVYPNKVVRSQQRYESVPQGQFGTVNGGFRQQQGHTQAIYSGY